MGLAARHICAQAHKARSPPDTLLGAHERHGGVRRPHRRRRPGGDGGEGFGMVRASHGRRHPCCSWARPAGRSHSRSQGRPGMHSTCSIECFCYKKKKCNLCCCLMIFSGWLAVGRSPFRLRANGWMMAVFPLLGGWWFWIKLILPTLLKLRYI